MHKCNCTVQYVHSTLQNSTVRYSTVQFNAISIIVFNHAETETETVTETEWETELSSVNDKLYTTLLLIFYAALHYSLDCTAPHRTTTPLHYSLHHTALHCTTLHNITLYISQHCTTLH